MMSSKKARIDQADTGSSSLAAPKSRPDAAQQPLRSAVSLVWPWLLAFFIPLVIFACSLFLQGIEPFGDKSFMAEDMKYQYVDFFLWFKSVLLGEGSLFYSSAQALGSNTWGLFSYYLSSPLNLLVVFFDDSTMGLFFVLITGIKIGCLGLTSFFYLRKRFNLGLGFVYPLSLCYSWSLWVITQLWNPLWLDGVVLMPLVAYGIYCLVTRGAWKPLLAALCACIITCWYIAYMVIVASVLFMIVEQCVCRFGEASTRLQQELSIGKQWLRYFGVLALSLLLCAFTFLPTIAAMMNQGGSDSLFGQIGSYLVTFSQEFLGIAQRLGTLSLLLVGLIGVLLIVGVLIFCKSKRFTRFTKGVSLATLALVALTVVSLVVGYQVNSLEVLLPSLFLDNWIVNNRLPQLFCGTGALFLFALFFFTRSIPKKIKVIVGLVFVFVCLSTILFILYFAWCGFKRPNGFYCRICFVAVFFMMFAAAYALQRVQHGQVRKSEVIAAALVILLCAVVVKLSGGFFTLMSFFVVVALVAVFVLVLIALLGSEKLAHATLWRTGLSALVLFCVMGEGLYCAQLSWVGRYDEYSRSEHNRYMQEVRAQLDELNAHDSSVYRIEKTYTRAEPAALNEGLTLNYRQLSSYSSANNASAVAFLNSLGYSAEGEFSTRYSSPLLLSDALLGVKYVATSPLPPGYKDVGLDETSSSTLAPGLTEGEDAKTENRFYENPYALGLGYGVDSAVGAATFEGLSNPFERQNAFISGLMGSETVCYKALEVVLVSDEQGELQWAVEVPANTVGYVYLSTDKNVMETAQTWISIDGQAPLAETGRFSHCIRYLSTVSSQDSVVSVTLTSAASTDENGIYPPFTNSVECLFYGLSLEVIDVLTTQLASRSFEIETFSDGFIKGSYVASDDEILMLSIPPEQGWTVMVNGNQVTPMSLFDNALMGIPVSEGSNSLELSFMPPGFVLGCLITSLTLVLGASVLIVRRKPWGRFSQ